MQQLLKPHAKGAGMKAHNVVWVINEWLCIVSTPPRTFCNVTAKLSSESDLMLTGDHNRQCGCGLIQLLGVNDDNKWLV